MNNKCPLNNPMCWAFDCSCPIDPDLAQDRLKHDLKAKESEQQFKVFFETGDAVKCIKEFEINGIKAYPGGYSKIGQLDIINSQFRFQGSEDWLDKDILLNYYEKCEWPFAPDPIDMSPGVVSIVLNGHELGSINQNDNTITARAKIMSFKEFEFINKIYQALQG